MSIVKKELINLRDEPSSESLKHGAEDVLNRICDELKANHQDFVKEAEIKEVLKKHYSFAKDAKLSNIRQHKTYLLMRKIYGQLRQVTVFRDIPNRSGQLRSSKVNYNNIDVWDYSIDNNFQNTIESYDLDDTFESYLCNKCSGNKKLPCKNCDCTGRVRYGDSYSACSNCSGSGYDECHTCSGYGSLYSFVKLEVKHCINGFHSFVLNDESSVKEKEWIESSEVIFKNTIKHYSPLEGERYVREDQIDDEIVRSFHQSSINYFDEKQFAKYICEYEYYINEYNMYSADITYNGITTNVGFNINEKNNLIIDKKDFKRFIGQEINDIIKTFKNRRLKRRLTIFATVATIAIAFIGYINMNSAENARKEQALREQRAQEKIAEESKQKEMRANFDKKYNEIMKLVREKKFESGHKLFVEALSKYNVSLNEEERKIHDGLKGISEMNKSSFGPDVISNEVFNKFINGANVSEAEFYWVCENLAGCKQAPKIIIEGFASKTKNLIRSNHRAISSERTKSTLLVRAGDKERTLKNVENSIKTYLKENGYSVNNLSISYSEPDLSDKHNGSWAIKGTTTIAGETLTFNTFANAYNVFDLKRQ